jgi:signal transduction histidine kinase
VGLGLAIVDAIAKAHGGRCTVKSSPQGSCFTLVLPGFRRATAPSEPTNADAEMVAALNPSVRVHDLAQS